MIKRILKKIIESIYEIFYIFKWIIDYLVRYKKNQKISKIYDSVIVVGNGPSVLNFDFQKAKNRGFEFLVVNYFALDEERFFNLRPKYYCIIDHFLFDKSTKQKFPNFQKLEEQLSRVDWDLNLITLSGQILGIKNEYIKCININSIVYKGGLNKFEHFLYNNNLASYTFQNVINAALFYLIAAKAKLVLLIGVENDWHRELSVGPNNEIFRETVHFYGKEKINIIEKGEINKGELYKYFYWYYLTLYSYFKANSYAIKNATKIYNCTPGSYIDVFDRIDFNSDEITK